MKRGYKIIIVLSVLILEYYLLSIQTDMKFSIFSEFFREVLGFDLVKNINIWSIIILLIGTYFIVVRNKVIEIAILIFLLLTLVLSYPFFNFQGVDRIF